MNLYFYRHSSDNRIAKNQSFLTEIKLVLSCHEHRFKHFNFQYIYPISYKIAKRQTLENGFALIEKRYHNNFKALIFTCSLQKHAIQP